MTAKLLIDGKPVRCWLFVYRKRDMRGDLQHYFVQVEAFDLDHAYRRVLMAYPVRRRNVEMLEELDAEHDIGRVGTKLLLPRPGSAVVNGPLTVQ